MNSIKVKIGEKNKDLDSIEDENILKAAGIIAFFGALDRADKEKFKEVAENFNFLEEDLWEIAEKLHEFEVVDLYENEVVKISDQILSTYLFYKVFFRDELLDFSILLNKFSENYRFDEAVFPVINTFNGDFVYTQLQKHVDKYWAEIKDDESKLLQLADKFWFLKQADTLLYIKDKIEAIDAEDYELTELKFESGKSDVKDKYLNILENFQRARTEDFRIALELIFACLEKRPEILPQVLYLLLEKFCFHVRSYDYGYVVQKTVINFLVEKANANSPGDFFSRKILLKIADKYLRTEFHSSWMESRNSINWSNFNLSPCPEIFEIRKIIWQFLIAEYSMRESSETVLQIISDYSSNTYEKNLDEATNAIIKEDAKTLLPFLVANLESATYRDCAIIQRYFRFLERHKVPFDKTLKKQFTNETYRISKVLSPDRLEIRGLYGENLHKYKRRIIKKFFEHYTFEDYVRFFKSCEEIKSLQKDYNAYQFDFSVGIVLNNLAETNEELFKRVIENMLASGNQLNHDNPRAIQNLCSVSPNLRDTYDLLQKFDYKLKPKWLLNFLIQLNTEQVDEFYLNELYALFQNSDVNGIYINFDNFVFYCRLDTKLIPNIVRILFERVRNSQIRFSFDSIFNSHAEIFKNLKQLFGGDVDLLKNVYLYEISINKHADHRSEALKTILEVEPEFIVEYLKRIDEEKGFESTRNDGYRYSALWELESYEAVILSALEYIFSVERRRIVFDSYADVFFRYEAKDNPSERDSLIFQRMENFVADYIRSHFNDSERINFIFSVIKNCFHAKRRHFLEIFLENNKNYEAFRRLDIEPHSWGGRGSMIPELEKIVEFLDSLKTLFVGIDFLKHRIHINEAILKWKDRIEHERRREFTNEF